MTDLEIPFEKDRKGHYRFFEILPGTLSYLLLLSPIILSLINVTAAVFAILAYLIIFFVRSLGYSARAISGYRTMRQHMALDWRALVDEIEVGQITATETKRPSWHYDNLARLPKQGVILKPSELTHAVIIATVNESREVLEPTIQSVINSDYDSKSIILVFAYEGRAGQEAEKRARKPSSSTRSRSMPASLPAPSTARCWRYCRPTTCRVSSPASRNC